MQKKTAGVKSEIVWKMEGHLVLSLSRPLPSFLYQQWLNWVSLPLTSTEGGWKVRATKGIIEQGANTITVRLQCPAKFPGLLALSYGGVSKHFYPPCAIWNQLTGREKERVERRGNVGRPLRLRPRLLGATVENGHAAHLSG